MHKIKRNELCQCGSGKKEKNCCKVEEKSRGNEQKMNNDLYHIHHNLILTVTNRYDELLQEQYKKFNNPLINDNETREIYNTGLTPWIISFISMFANEETILERYYRIVQDKIDPLLKSVIVRWFNKQPSVYKVLSVGTPKQNFLHVQDLKTDETFFVPFQNSDDFIEGNLLIGILVPYVKHQNFFITMVKLYHRDEKIFIDLLKQYAEKEGGLAEHYPQFLAEALHNGLTMEEWADPLHEEVANLFAKHMSEKGFNDVTIMDGIEKWNIYCSKNKPAIQKAEPFAAALDYYVQREILKTTNVKQVDLAEEYSISPSTLSRNYRQLVNEFNN